MEPNNIIYTEKAPKPIGPYSQAILRGNTLFVSGQIAFIPSTGKMDTSNIENETRQVMENIKAIVEESGMKMSDIVKSSIFLINMDDFSKMNEVYAKYFPENPPARETIQVSALPKKMNVEISVIAIK
ncbi:MAG: RidA family protein [Bacteroidetes bacterium]|nr:MAG: RidA family protein [Bacteroidota bacterium]